MDVPILEELSQRFLRKIDYYRPVELEYKLDRRDGRYKLLDVNARTWGYHSLGVSAGVDFSYMLFADQLGTPVTECKGKPGLAWMRTTTDLPAAMVAVFHGDTSLKEYLRSLRNCNAEAVFSASDPCPALPKWRSSPTWQSRGVSNASEYLLPDPRMRICK